MRLVAHGYIEIAQEVVNRIASEQIKNHLMRLRIIKAKKALMEAQTEWTEVKNDLVKEYGEEVEGGVQIDPKQENFSEFNEKYAELSLQTATLVIDAFPEQLLNMFDLSSDDIEILQMVGLVADDEEQEVGLPDSSEPA